MTGQQGHRSRNIHKSVWRGLEYYNQNKVLSCEDNGDGTYEGVVSGSGRKKYKVHLDMNHPRKSTCNCPFADGKMIMCKHIVAVSFCVDASEIDRFKNELTPYASMEEESKARRYDSYMRYAKMMSKEELREAYVEAMLELDEIRSKNGRRL